MHEKTSARVVRGLVKAMYIGCYAAFLWASIHHVAAFFNDFEGTTGNTLGSYALAAAFDVTAIITTIGVMFFRKSMPRRVQVIVWAFIIGIAVYSFLMNWEYTSHYQSASLILQPTGETTPVYDVSGILHYVPVMHANTTLLSINPALASGFTIFALIYSIIAEFFGAKPPTVDELQARKHYLEETGAIIAAIHQLEAQHKKPGLIQWGKGQALEIKSAVKEVASRDTLNNETEASNQEQNTEESAGKIIPITEVHDATNDEQNTEESPTKNEPGNVKMMGSPGSASGKTITIKEAAERLGLSVNYVRDLRNNGTLKRSPRNRNLLLKSGVERYQNLRQNTPVNGHKKEPITGELQAVNAEGKAS